MANYMPIVLRKTCDGLVCGIEISTLTLVFDEINEALVARPDLAAKFGDMMMRAEHGTKQVGIVAVRRVDCGCVMVDLLPAQDLLDFLKEVESAQ